MCLSGIVTFKRHDATYSSFLSSPSSASYCSCWFRPYSTRFSSSSSPPPSPPYSSPVVFVIIIVVVVVVVIIIINTTPLMFDWGTVVWSTSSLSLHPSISGFPPPPIPLTMRSPGLCTRNTYRQSVKILSLSSSFPSFLIFNAINFHR